MPIVCTRLLNTRVEEVQWTLIQSDDEGDDNDYDDGWKGEPELQNRANRANQLVLFFLAGANFWEKHAKNRRKHAKTGENTRKQAKNRRFFGANFFVGKIGRC